MRASMMLTRQIARDLIDSGTYARFHLDAIPYPEANALFDAKPGRNEAPSSRSLPPEGALSGRAAGRH